jgi:tellurite resistance protein
MSLERNPQSLQDRWFARATNEQKRAALHVLVAVGTGDGKLTAEEKHAIAQACSRMGLSAFEVAEGLVRGMPEAIDPPTSRHERVRLLLDAAAVMVADRRIDDRELAVILMVGGSLGFSQTEVERIIAEVVRAAQAEEDREAVINRLLST